MSPLLNGYKGDKNAKRKALNAAPNGTVPREGAVPDGEPEDVPPRKVAVPHEEKKRPPGERSTSASEFVIASLGRARKRTAFWVWGFFLTNLGWLCVLLGVVAFFAVQLSAPRSVAIIDPAHTVYLAPLQNASNSRDLLDEMAALAALSYLQRNPNGLDLQWLFDRMYGKASAQKVKAELEEWKKQAAPTNLRWKVEITKNLPLNAVESNVVLDRVTGRIKQSATVNGLEEGRWVKFVLSLKLTHNPELISLSRYPYAVADYAITYQPDEADAQGNP